MMISGAPASGKGTQCELIVRKVTILIDISYLFIVYELRLYIEGPAVCVWNG